MPAGFETALYSRIRRHLDGVRIVDSHEHLQRDSELPSGEGVSIGRLFAHYASCDLISAGMSPAHMAKLQDGRNGLSPTEQWRLIKPWYQKAWNTAYCESLRIALRDLYGVEDFSDTTAEPLTRAMQKQVKPGFTRKVLDKAGIDFVLNHPLGPAPIFNADFDPECFLVDMLDNITPLPITALANDSGMDILSLDDYLPMIDRYFERYARAACAFKVLRAYDRPLSFEDVPRSAVEKTFNRLLAFNDRPDQRKIRALEDFLMHYLCRKCGEYGLRMKFHAGIQEGNGNIITHSRAALLTGLFLKYPKTGFDIFHISYPYQDEAAVLAKVFPNVTVDFCWMWLFPAAARRALSDMLDIVPANKIHGFGGDCILVEGSYGHAVIARREIARVLAEKVEERRFTEDYALKLGDMFLRENVMDNFGLEQRRKAFKAFSKKPLGGGSAASRP